MQVSTKLDAKIAELELCLRESAIEREKRPRRKFYGAEISEDFGTTWRIKALCAECVKKFEPPTRVKDLNPAARNTARAATRSTRISRIKFYE